MRLPDVGRTEYLRFVPVRRAPARSFPQGSEPCSSRGDNTARTSNTKRRTVRSLVPAAVALAGIAFVAGCGGLASSGHQYAASGSGASSSAAHNAADVAFATDMIPHHAQAVEMADLALAVAADPEVKALAQAIKGAQDPEIKTMTGWFTGWKAPGPGPGWATSCPSAAWG